MHVRPRSSRIAPSGGVCDRPRRRPGSGAQSSPSSSASAPPATTSTATSGFVSVRRGGTRHTTVVHRTGVRSRSVVPEGAHEHVGNRESSGAASTGRLIRLVHWYQRAFEGRPSPCRFTPSCSCYAIEALEIHGTALGLRLTVRRLLRCRPFGPSGFDPVPEPIGLSPLPHRKGV